MLRESATNLLKATNRARFTSNLAVIYDEYDSDMSSDEDDAVPMRF